MKILKKSVILSLSLILALFALSSCMDMLPFFGSSTDTEPGEEPAKKSEYTVTFDTQGGTEIAPVVVKTGEKFYRPYDSIKAGATFDGWYYNGRLWDFDKDTVKRDMTLVAKWNYTDYKITYDLRGGSYSGDMPTTFNVETDTITFGTPSREYSEFLGWEINGVKTNEIPKGTMGEVKVVATWFGLEAEVMLAKDGADGIVVFIHDDARLDTMEIFDDLLKKYGFVGDVGFILNKIYDGNSLNTTALQNYKEYIDNGRWKIVNHSATHNWWGSEIALGTGATFPTENYSQLKYELETSQQKLRQFFPGQRVLTFAYPGFSSIEYKYIKQYPNILKDVIYSPTARNLIETHHISARMYSGGATTISDENTDWNWMNAQFLTEDFINHALDKALIDTVEKGLLNIFSFHGLTNNETQYNSDLGYYLYGSDMEKVMQKVNAYVEKGEIWNTHYEDAILYLREAKTANVVLKKSEGSILLTLTDEMDDEIYDAAITLRLKNYSDGTEWEAAKIVQGENTIYVTPTTAKGETYLQFDLVPDKGDVTISPIALEDIPVNN